MAGVKGKSGGARPNTGGARPGAGRKPKPPTVIVAELLPPVAGEPLDPRPAMEAIAKGMLEVSAQQYKALALLMPYVHPKKGEGGKKEQKQAAAEKAGAGKFGLRSVK